VTRVGLLSLADDLADPTTGRRATQAERLRQIVDAAVMAEQAGFAHVGLGEHHFGHYILPSPFLLLAAIAARTRRIRLGTSVTLLACLDPVRIAEDLATLDLISGGRAELTVARGVEPATMSAFGITDSDTLRARFDEHLRLLLRLMTEDHVTWSGRFRAPLREVRLSPRPVQTPHPTISVGGGLSTISCDLAVELGLPLALPSLFRFPEDYLPIVERYREGMAARGRGDRASVSYPSYVHVARTSQEARARWRPHLEAYGQFAVECRGSHGRPMDYESLLRGPAICGSPAEVVDRIAEVNQQLGLDVHYLMLDAGGLPPEQVRETIERLGSDVLPRLRG
jgi:alkanesulfonate monooxygenase SsuD/methylene tetrahydromethanopterin reductase-like flavin-dependent oxidoreductase (luciferase family)